MKLPDLILTDQIRSAVNHAFRVKDYSLKLGSVREKRTSRKAAWVFGNTIHWNSTAFRWRANGDARFWRGVCHECAHIHQEQKWGRWRYMLAVLRGVWLSGLKFWDHDVVPMEQEADLIATKTWRPMRDFFEAHYGAGAAR